MVAPIRNTLAKSKQKHKAPSHNNDNSKKFVVGVAWWHPEEIPWLSRSKKVLESTTAMVHIRAQNSRGYNSKIGNWPCSFWALFGVLFLHPLFRILGPGAKPLDGPYRPNYYLWDYPLTSIVFPSFNIYAGSGLAHWVLGYNVHDQENLGSIQSRGRIFSIFHIKPSQTA